jgi:hypothetical protein
MKKAPLLLLAGLLALAGCTRHYVITPSRGPSFTVKGKPRYDKATDSFIFTDATGRKCAIPSASVREIAPASMSSQPTATPVKPSRGR